jgi:exopolysaccharide biosynthesis polyprenyl glycosylphosphotransferase
MIKAWLYLIVFLFALAGLFVVLHFSGGVRLQFMGESLGLIVVLLSCQICFHLNGVDELLVDSKPQLFIQRILKSVGAALVIAALLFYILPRLHSGYAAAAAVACVLMFIVVAARPIVRSLVNDEEPESTVIVGSEAVTRELYGDIVEQSGLGRFRTLNYADLNPLAKRERISRVVVADAEMFRESDAAETLIDLKLQGVRVESALELFERTRRKVWIEGLSAESVIFTNGFCPSRIYLAMKRLLDLVLSVALLMLTAPLMATISVIVKLETQGPAIFSQERVGMMGRQFIVYKFRSMRQDAERHSGPTWAKEKDERITRVGAILRKTRLDELPQVWNVLRGDMTFIGPRPERPYFVDMLRKKIRYYDLRHSVKPGITGWAQVMYPYGASIEDSYHKLEYDLYYAKNISIRLDLLILVKTIGVVLKGEGR